VTLRPGGLVDLGRSNLLRKTPETDVPDDGTESVLSPVVWVRFPRMLLAAYLTGAFCVAATAACYLLRGRVTATLTSRLCAAGAHVQEECRGEDIALAS
jgi:cytochrome bd-type quinol oxidase subunit 1